MANATLFLHGGFYTSTKIIHQCGFPSFPELLHIVVLEKDDLLKNKNKE